MDEVVGYEAWLVDICVLFPNLFKLAGVYRIYDYSSRNPGDKYADLEWFHFSQDGENTDKLRTQHPPHGTVYLYNGLRVDESFINWDRIIDGQVDCWADDDLVIFKLQEYENAHPGFNTSKIHCLWGNLISGLAYDVLVHDAARFEAKRNKGRWCSFDHRVEQGVRFSNKVPEQLKGLFSAKEIVKFAGVKERAGSNM